MRFKIVKLGGAGRAVTDIAKAIVNYLREQASADRAAAGRLTDEPSAARYYADSSSEAGRWLGRGAAALGLEGLVADGDFAAALAGRDPRTGGRLISAQGSAGRTSSLGVGQHTRCAPDGRLLYDANDAAAVLRMTPGEAKRMLEIGALANSPDDQGPVFEALRRQPPGSYLRPVRLYGALWATAEELERCRVARKIGTTPAQAAVTGDLDDDLSIAEAARIAGLSDGYMRRLARTYADGGAAEAAELVDGLKQPAYLVARRGAKDAWIVKRRDLVAYLKRREPPPVRVGFDATLTTEKSLGVLALLSDDATGRAVLDAIREGSDWALDWLEQHHAVARDRGEVVKVKGWTVASFRHYTSRALDPFPHLHNVVLNTVEDDKGVRRALDARSLHIGSHAASALATAQMRYRLTTSLGVRWRPSSHGGWEIAGIPDAVLREFSQRRSEIEEALRELEEAIGRGTTLEEVDQIAKTTRPPKTQAAVAELLANWWRRAEGLSFRPNDLARCVGEPVEPTEPDLEAAFAQLGGPEGICENISVFNRGDLLNALVDLPIESDSDAEAQPMCVPAARLDEIADTFLASSWVEQIGDATDSEPARFSTREMLAVQDRIVARHRSGLHRSAALVPKQALQAALDQHPHLTDEQTALVRGFCTSGHRFQCAIGHPGAGKTTAMLAARQAWEAAGWRVVGAAVKGEAARNLAATTGIPTETLAWHLARDDPRASALDARTVLVVDEASTVSDRDLDRIGWLAEQTGAIVRLIGDPAQHSAVAAGGMFRVLCELHPKQTPEVTKTHRLRDPHDRAAAEALRAGNVDNALRQLAAAGHLHIVEDELSSYVQVLINWWHAHLAGHDHPMVDRTNTVRRSLNRLAHALRQANGELGDDVLVSNGRHFAVGDHVIARTPNRGLHPPGERANYLRNGAQGTIAAIRRSQQPDGDLLTVTFHDIGTIDLPRSFIDEHEIGPGQSGVGIDYAYAVTSYAVTGATQSVSTSRINETSSRAEVYVDITRGQLANHLYVTRAADPLDGEQLPTPPTSLAQVVADRLQNSRGERTAWEIRQNTIEKADGLGSLGL